MTEYGLEPLPDRDPTPPLEEPPDDELCECWCGAKGTFDELFSTEVFDRGCHGSGTLNCICGGDFCVCHWHGEVECEGCEDCERDDDRDYDDDFDTEHLK